MRLSNRKFNRSNRRGAVLVTVLVCLAVVGIILLTAVTSSLRQRRQLRQELQLEQTKWIVDAGVRKAIVEFDNSPDFKGLTFDLSAEFEKHKVARLEIKRDSDKDSKSQILVVTSLMAPEEDSPMTTKRSKEIVIE